MSDLIVGPNDAQEYVMDGLRAYYGIDDWWMKGTTVRLRDKAGYEWLISPSGIPQCLGGGVVADEPEPEEEDL